ncbi:MAG: DUF3142 domain-containing protein [Acidobacteriaceae bacterium]
MARVLLSARRWLFVAVTIALVCGIASLHHWQTRAATIVLPSLPATFADRVPQRVLWAWEEPEDLQALLPSIGVAYLAETDILTDHISVLPRRQPLSPAPGAPLIAVIRIETRPGFADTPALRAALATHLAAYGARGGVGNDVRGGVQALQLDFDATQSQRAFYRGVLEGLRPQLPRKLPLSITALVSWCGPHSWLHGLPIEEAVPMEFRMGGPRALAFNGTSRRYAITEPLCRTSLGLSTDEPWPASVAALNPSTRVYLFAPRPWRPAELSAIATTPISSLAQEMIR